MVLRSMSLLCFHDVDSRDLLHPFDAALHLAIEIPMTVAEADHRDHTDLHPCLGPQDVSVHRRDSAHAHLEASEDEDADVEVEVEVAMEGMIGVTTVALRLDPDLLDAVARDRTPLARHLGLPLGGEVAAVLVEDIEGATLHQGEVEEAG